MFLLTTWEGTGKISKMIEKVSDKASLAKNHHQTFISERGLNPEIIN